MVELERSDSERKSERESWREGAWVPKTRLGRDVLEGKYSSLEQVFDSGRKILEPQIIDFLLKGQLKEEVLEVTSTQRMTACGRKQLMRVVLLLGNQAGFVGVGVGKALETRDSISEAILDAKKNLIRVRLGCGSWECGCGKPHSIAQTARGNNGSTHILIKPAPRGVGIVAGAVAKKVLQLAGVQDAWTFTKGNTSNALNMVLATMNALNSLNKLKKGVAAVQESESEEVKASNPAGSGGVEGGAEAVEAR